MMLVPLREMTFRRELARAMLGHAGEGNPVPQAWRPPTAVKYSEDQPRDDHGRWSAGGAPDVRVAAGAGRLPPDTSQWEYFYHTVRETGQVDHILREGVQPAEGRSVYLSNGLGRTRNETPYDDSGAHAGYVVVRVPAGEAREGTDQQQREYVLDRPIGPEDVVSAVRAVQDGRGNYVYENDLARFALAHPDSPEARYLPPAYQRWFTAAKYSPDQPRDERGRWSDGGAADVPLGQRGGPTGEHWITPLGVADHYLHPDGRELSDPLGHSVHDEMDTEERLDKEYRATLEQINRTYDENEAVRGYLGESYSWWNDALRNGAVKDLPREERSEMRELEKITERQPLAEDATFYRGMVGAEADLKPGDVIRDRGFTSLSASRTAAEGFVHADGHESVILKVQVPAGTKGLWTSSQEREFITHPGTSFRVVETGVYERGGYFGSYGQIVRQPYAVVQLVQP